MPEPDTAWNWTAPSRSAPDHVHARHELERGELVLIITGTAGGALPLRKAGARLNRAAALELARFILSAESNTAAKG
jgi:hypothetical protein